MLRSLMGKADKMQEQIGNVSRERGNPKNESRRTEKDCNVKGAVMPLMSLDMAGERISELEDI